jgi:hypothetical protein
MDLRCGVYDAERMAFHMTTVPDPEQVLRWRNPELPWWAKIRRARSHIGDINRQVADFYKTEPWSVEAESGRVPNESAYRLRVHKSIPADLLAAVGDVVHNMRSALDCVAYELARHHVGAQMTPEQEALTEFPITENAEIFGSWFNTTRKGYRRSELYGDQERAALRCVQPFWFSEEAAEHGVDAASMQANEWKANAIRRLHLVSNIDKHRRLPLLTWFPDLTYWEAPTDGSSLMWKPAMPVDSEFSDGTLLGYLLNMNGSAPPDVKVFHDMRLTIFDDARYRTALPDELSRWIGSISGWTIPRALIVAGGFERPILIDGSWQAI